MSTNRQSTRNFWSTVIKIILFLFALYFAFRLLTPLLFVLLGISFWIVKVIVFIALALLVLHVFLKLIFGINLFQKTGLRSWRR